MNDLFAAFALLPGPAGWGDGALMAAASVLKPAAWALIGVGLVLLIALQWSLSAARRTNKRNFGPQIPEKADEDEF
jgi:hypothetical protein